uniref:AT1G73110 protein n=1 Tax=Arabidopsis thaliana TaxID=3702 RepID=C0Z2A6_ARATH|nr:AT1G73110 [Arabidopsis thaliana]
MALANISLRFKFPPLQSSSSSSSSFNATLINTRKLSSIVCSKPSSNDGGKVANDDGGAKPRKKLSEQSSWEVKDSEGKDYLYRLGAESDNVNIAVGARSGMIDDVFIGDFLGKDC